jgi:DNA-binding LacI/PurR family transcriptional regulator
VKREKSEGKSTFHEIAQHAGVSTATVSRVVNRSARVSPVVEKRVREAAEELGVRLQRRSGGRLIGFLLGNRTLMHPFHSQVMIAAEECCTEHDYSLLFFPLRYPSDVGWDRLHVPNVIKRRDILDGLIVSGVTSENLLQLLTHVGLPFSVFGDTTQGEWNPHLYDVVWIDDVIGAYEMTRYLHSLGHEHVWYVANTKLTWFARRLEGYSRAMEGMGLKPLVSSIDSGSEHEVGFLATKYILQQGQPVQAIFCGADAICHGVYAALRDAGLRVPEDISVAGFNDTPEATVLHPPVTSVRVFPEHVGRILAELVMNRINNPGLNPENRMIPTQVVKRESCRPPTGAETPRQRLSLLNAEEASGTSVGAGNASGPASRTPVNS